MQEYSDFGIREEEINEGASVAEDSNVTPVVDKAQAPFIHDERLLIIIIGFYLF
ncbi:hypothetical protein [Citrobacter freundii complex sp. CFNIH2]|uniref:hypothetical protein n=1 Tax=Citrobacter freundii complex sp. CFNIH2 TaxID=2066049 RepID=UPI0016528180|nr:hypothetical protein [Citrobacter freundii complex sp. CFNIH2]